jgi:uncharacterized protein
VSILFIHGGGDEAFRFDADIVNRLREALRTDLRLEYPHIEGLERIEWEPTSRELTARFAELPRNSTVIAHSVGAAATLKLVSETSTFAIRNLFLLAAPYKGEDSHWGIDDFSFTVHFAKHLEHVSVWIYHSRDDNIIPVDDALLYKEKLSTANFHLLDGYGHQFSGPLDFLANDIRSAVVR